MRVALASDHAGFELKETIASRLRELGHEVHDLSPGPPDPQDDYPDSAEALGLALRKSEAERGVLICGSGVGASVAANKVKGIRAGLCHDTYSAHQGVEHDDMNVLVFGARIIGEELAKELVAVFLKAQFSGEPRHVRRLAKIGEIESRFCD
jgi:RpiB/LacA/LacB family sugar-phosphate isomerase